MNVKLSWSQWFGGLVAAVVQTIGTSGSFYLGGIVTGHHIDWEALGGGLSFSAAVTFFAWISTHPLPIRTETVTTTTTVDKDTGAMKAVVVKETRQETPVDPKVEPWDGKTERRG